MKHLYTLLLFIACTCTCAYAQSFCSQVQPVGTFYTDTITQPGTYYYSAWTFDLPMQVHFVPSDPSVTTPPQIWVDLTCEPGIYSDPNIQELVRDTAKYGISVPMKLNGTSTRVDDHWEFDLRIGKSYRNKLKLVGVDYNVQAYVKVTYTSPGSLVMEQDTSANVCVNEAKRIELDGRYRILEHDSVTTYLLPYKEWLDQGVDSVALRWEGAEPATVWTHGTNCEFGLNVRDCWDRWQVAANGGEYHVMREQMETALSQGTQDTTGLFFTKIYSNGEGYLSVRQLYPDLKGSTLLLYNKKNDITPDSLYSFAPTWKATEWQARTRRAVYMYVYDNPQINALPVDSFKFVMQGDTMRVLSLNNEEMKSLNNRARETLMYARFACTGNFKLLPTTWQNRTCSPTSTWLRSGQVIDISRKGKDDIYYVYASDWKDYAYDVTWTGNGILQCYLSDACTYTLRPTNSHVCGYHAFSNAGSTHVETTDDAYADWEQTDEEGFVYIRFNHNDPGTVCMRSYAPFILPDPEDGELDPVYYDDIVTPPGPTTGFTNEAQAPVIRKVVLPTGQLVILRDGAAYDLQGRRLL